MGLLKPDVHDGLEKFRTMPIFDHFTSYASGGLWTSITTGSGATVAAGDGDGGILTVTTGATLNNEAGFKSTNKLATFVANKGMWAQYAFKYTEANTDDAGIVMGWASSWTNILADTTFALPTTLSGALIYKKPNDTLWSGFGSVSTTQSSQQSIATCQQAAITQVMSIQAIPDPGGMIEITFWAGPYGVSGGTPGYTPMLPNVTSMARQQPIKFFISYASAAAMQFGFFVKAGGSNSEVVSVDMVGGEFLSIP